MSSTVTKILDSAQELAQKRGLNAFSYADISDQVGIKKASIHYHFPTKSDLTIKLIERYRQVFNKLLEDIDSNNSSAVRKLEEYIKLYQNTLRDDRMCLCGMLASDISTLPNEVQLFVQKFFDDNERWLEEVLAEGQADGSLRFTGQVREVSQLFLSSVQGALLVSKALNSEVRFNSTTDELLNTITK